MVDVTTIEIALMPLIFVYIIWRKYGGWPEAWYRMNGTPHFFQIIFSADGTPSKHIHKSDIITTNSPATYPYNDRLWGIDPDNAARSVTGRPLYYYRYDNLNPIPINKWDEKAWGPKINGELLMAAAKNTAIERMHSFGRKQPIPWFLLLAVGVIAIVLVAVNIYYSHDTLCAVKPALC
jgi:hypothetical protein